MAEEQKKKRGRPKKEVTLEEKAKALKTLKALKENSKKQDRLPSYEQRMEEARIKQEKEEEQDAQERIDKPMGDIVATGINQAPAEEAPRNAEDNARPYRHLTAAELAVALPELGQQADNKARAAQVAKIMGKVHQSQPFSQYGANRQSRAIEEQFNMLTAEAIQANGMKSAADNLEEPDVEKVRQLMERCGFSTSRPKKAAHTPTEEKKEEMKPVENKTISVGLARRIWKNSQKNECGYAASEAILDTMFPDKAYKRPYQYGAVCDYELNMDAYFTCDYSAFQTLLRYYGNWIGTYYGEDADRDEKDLKFSIHRVYIKETNTYDFVTVEDSYSTRPLSFPTKDMADNFKQIFKDLLESAGQLV